MFGNPGALGEGHVEIDPAWTTQDVAAGTVTSGNCIRIRSREVGFKVLIAGCPRSCIVGIEVDDRPSLSCSNQVSIACSRGTRIASSRQQAGIHVQREASVPEENREDVPA